MHIDSSWFPTESYMFMHIYHNLKLKTFLKSLELT